MPNMLNVVLVFSKNNVADFSFFEPFSKAWLVGFVDTLEQLLRVSL